MGLDMYLRKGDKGNSKDTYEVAYWRKANQIRNWFVNNTDYDENSNCKLHLVTEEQLEKLEEDCETVLINHEKAEELLPTSSGFFFGSTDYDEWYYRELIDTICQIRKILATTNFEIEDIYYYEWW